MIHSSSACSGAEPEVVQRGIREEGWSECFGSGGGGRTLSASDQGQELVTCLGVLSEHAEHGAGHRLAVHLLNASHDHAHVTGEHGDEMK